MQINDTAQTNQLLGQATKFLSLGLRVHCLLIGTCLLLHLITLISSSATFRQKVSQKIKALLKDMNRTVLGNRNI